MALFIDGVDVVLYGSGGEIGRVFVPYAGSDNFSWRITKAIQDEGWQIDAGDTIRIVETSHEAE